MYALRYAFRCSTTYVEQRKNETRVKKIINRDVIGYENDNATRFYVNVVEGNLMGYCYIPCGANGFRFPSWPQIRHGPAHITRELRPLVDKSDLFEETAEICVAGYPEHLPLKCLEAGPSNLWD